MEEDTSTTMPPTRDLTTSDIEAPGSPCSSTDTNQKPDFWPANHAEVGTISRISTIDSRLSIIQSRTSDRVKVVQCPICCEGMTTPKLLPCLHNVCKRCLQQYILSSLRTELQNNITPKTFPCPVCNKQIEPSLLSSSIEKWAAQFPTNYFLHTYGMVLAVQKEEIECEPCLRRGESTIATWWCRECGEYQCNVCKTVHGGFKIFKHHKVLAIKEIANNPNIAIPKNEPCAEHKENIIQFCREHAVPCCSTCVATTHRKCDNVVSIKEEFLSLKSKGEFERLADSLKTLEDKANELIGGRKKTTEQLAKRKQDIETQVKLTRRGMEEKLKQLEDDLLHGFDQNHSTEMEYLSDAIVSCENIKKQVSNAAQLMEAVKNVGNETHMISLLGNVKREYGQYESALKEHQREFQTIDYEFHADRVVENVLKTATLFGNINIKRSHHKPQTVMTAKPSHKGDTPKQVARFRVNIAGDRGRCGILGGAFLEDGRILLADFDNFKLKLFHGNGRVLGNLVLKSKPSDLTMVRENKAVVTYPSANGIQFIQLRENVMTEDHHVSTSRIYHGVSCDTNNIYLVANSGIAICDIEGKEIRFIKPAQQGAPSFLHPGYIRATPIGIIVTDYGRNSVFTLTLDGRLIHTYTHKDLNHPLGVDLDSNGNIFVCSKNSSNVHQLTEDGQRVNIILSQKDGIENPFIIRFQRFTDKFFVSESKLSSRNFIKIFE